VTQKYRLMATKLPLHSTRLHALRHHSATELLTAGVDLRTVAGRLGHGDGTTTLRAYAALVAAADRRAGQSLANRGVVAGVKAVQGDAWTGDC
jgi:integrase